MPLGTAGSQEELGWGTSIGEQEEAAESVDSLLHGAGTHDTEQLHLNYSGLAADAVWLDTSATHQGSESTFLTQPKNSTGDCRTAHVPGRESSRKGVLTQHACNSLALLHSNCEAKEAVCNCEDLAADDASSVEAQMPASRGDFAINGMESENKHRSSSKTG